MEHLADERWRVREPELRRDDAGLSSSTSSTTGDTKRLQPGCPCGSTADNGIDTVDKPVAAITNANGGMPVARARNVEPSHGSVVDVSIAERCHEQRPGMQDKPLLAVA